MESNIEEVDFILLPAVFLQQLHQHCALFGFLILFLFSLLLLGSHLLIILIILLILIILIILIILVLLTENQLKLGVLPK